MHLRSHLIVIHRGGYFYAHTPVPSQVLIARKVCSCWECPQAIISLDDAPPIHALDSGMRLYPGSFMVVPSQATPFPPSLSGHHKLMPTLKKAIQEC